MAMWKVMNFLANEVVHRRDKIIYADEKGRLKKVFFENSSPVVSLREKTEECYYPDEVIPLDILASAIDLTIIPVDVKVGDWVISKEGIFAKVLQVQCMNYKAISGTSLTAPSQVFIKTIFGMNKVDGLKPNPTFLVDKSSFSRVDTYKPEERVGKLKAHILAEYVANNFDMLATHDAVYKKNDGPQSKYFDKYLIKRKLTKILSTAEGQAIFAALLIKRYGESMTFDEWRQKIVDSVPDTITKQIHLDMWKILGQLEPEVRKKLDEASGKEPSQEDSKSVFPTDNKKLTTHDEAQYKDVCEYCNDSKVYKTKTTTGTEVEIECPYCKPKNGSSVSSVPQEDQKIRV